MKTSNTSVTLKVDASAFAKQIEDPVQKNEILGRFANADVKAPCDGSIAGVSFDANDHALIVVIQPRSTSS